MANEEAIAALSGQHELVLATIEHDGKEVTHVVSFEIVDEFVHLLVDPESPQLQNILRRKRVRFASREDPFDLFAALLVSIGGVEDVSVASETVVVVEPLFFDRERMYDEMDREKEQRRAASRSL
jgi:hypothetical protein